MVHESSFVRLLLFVPILWFAAGCDPSFDAAKAAATPSPTIATAVNNVRQFTDSAAFEDSLLKALSARDLVKLQAWMTDPLVTGTWRGDLVNLSRADAVKQLFAKELGANSRLTPINLAEIKQLMGGRDPLSIPRADAGVENAFLIMGWGRDGRDEAILFIARQKDNSLRLHGWMVIQGGFSGARVGGIRLYENQAQGYQVFLPKGYEVTASGNQVAVVAPREGSDPGVATIAIEPAKGRTTEQVADQVMKTAKAQLGPGAEVKSTTLKIESAQAVIITGLPGQDPNRQLFMVRGDRLYHMNFSPNDARAVKAYEQMQGLYAMIVNTFHFTK